MKSIIATSALLLTVIPATLVAQMPRADGTRLRPGVDTMAIFMIRGGDTARTGTVIDQLASRSIAGQRVWVRTYDSQDKVLGSRRDSLTDRQVDLRPVRHQSVSTLGIEAVGFVAGKATGWRRPRGGDSTTVALSLPAGTINASSFDLFLRAAPLAPGYQLNIPAFVSTPGTVITLTAKVVGTEQVAGARCWRIEADFAGMAVTFWVTQDGRRLQQQVMQLQPGVALLFRRHAPTG